MEILKVLVIALFSFGVGFALVFFLLRPPAPTEDRQDDAAVSSPAPETLGSPAMAVPGTNAGGYAPPDPGEGPVADAEPPAPVYGDTPADASLDGDQAAGQGDAPPEVPPGKTPENVTIDGSAFYLKCWDDSGVEHAGKECDALSVLEKRFETRLYVVDKCRRDHAGSDASGKLSVAAEVDFQQMRISFWNGASSEIPNASQIGSCLRTSLTGLPIHGIDHKYARYRLFFTVLFGNAAAKHAQAQAKIAAKFVSGKGKLVKVVKDKVRVRKTAVDGEVIGKIGVGSEVKLLEQKAGWCHVITPNQNEGWMICDALEL